MLEFSMLFISLAIFVTLIKFFVGNTVWEKLLALNLISVKVILLICIYAVYKKNPMLLDIGIIYGIIGFLTVIILTRFVIKGGRQK